MTVPDTPYTRGEMYLSAIANGDTSGIPEAPYTRKEKYLDAIAKGDASGIPDTPYTREEMYLDAIAQGGGGGGGGLEYETGEYTPASDITELELTFANSHDDLPFYALVFDASGTLQTNANSNTMFEIAVPYNLDSKFFESAGTYGRTNAIYRATSSPSGTGTNLTSIEMSGSGTGSVSRYLTESKFVAYNSDSRYWRAGRTYKWVAVWKPAE